MCCLTSQPHDLTEPRTLLSVRLVSVCGSPSLQSQENVVFFPLFLFKDKRVCPLTNVVNDCRPTCLFLRSVLEIVRKCISFKKPK